MKTDFKPHRRSRKRSKMLFKAAFLLLLGWTASALSQDSTINLGPRAQTASARGGCGEAFRLPLVPTQEPRLGQGNELANQWQTQQPADAAATAALIEPLKGNDALIELVVGQSRLVTLKMDLADERGAGLIAVGDPTMLDFDVLPNPRVLRLSGRRIGVTDLSLVTPDGQAFCFEVHVGYDLALMQAKLKQVFPDAQLRLYQIREHMVVEGQARSIRQVDQIMETLKVYLASIQVPSSVENKESGTPNAPADGGGTPGRGSGAQDPSLGGLMGDEGLGSPGAGAGDEPLSPGMATPESGGKPKVEASFVMPQIINLIRVPGVQQVLLQVQIAELNRTALRNIGADFTKGFGGGNVLQTLIGGGASTVTGVFPTAELEFVLRALRTNTLLSVLAEPNLVASSGERANFLAGGEFPVPVPQNSGGGTTITVEYKTYGVQLEFLPYVLEDDTIRLTVTPEESSPDSSNAIEIDGYFVPGINTRRASTTVEMRQGQTLAIAGLLRVTIEANTKRIPGLGDLPYIGPLFSNTSHTRTEKELIVLVTPYLVNSMNPDQVPPLPGSEITDPNDLEFYLLNRISGRTDCQFLSTRIWDDPFYLVHLLRLERNNVCGPCGFSSSD